MFSPELSITLALLSTVTSNFLFRREDELLSEIICWVSLPLIHRICASNEKNDSDSRFLTNIEFRPARPLSLWAVAACLSIVSFFRAEANSAKLLNRQRSILPTLPPFEKCIYSLAPRVVVVLLIALFARVSLIGLPSSNALSSLLLGIMKALAWFYTAQSAHCSSWSLASMLASFSLLSTHNPFNFSSESQAVSHVLGSLLTLAQICGVLPKQVRPKWVLISAILLPLIPYSATIVTIHRAQLEAQTFSESNSHPVEVLFNRSRYGFQNMLARQSTSYEMASSEYRSRYGLDPPPGFESWFQRARSLGSPLIDEFDTIHRSISALRSFSGKDIQKAMRESLRLPGIDLWLCQFSSATLKTECSHLHQTFDRHMSRMFNSTLMNATELPDVQFLVNHIDEPRVLDHSAQDGKISVENHSHKSVWDLITMTCHSIHDGEKEEDGIKNSGLPFVTNVTSSQDLCRHPEYNDRHGLTSSPVSFRPIKGPLPVLSTGTLSTMRDILFPSPAYTESEFIYDEASDVEWDQKRNGLYWAGSTTGGYATNTNWQLFHRQRFVELAQNQKKRNYYLRIENGVAKRVESSFLNGRLFNVAFTRIFQCERKSCRDQDAHFGIKAWVDKDAALKSKLAFDIDGNGISGRFYKLLASKSMPLKQTLLREWHDDRLVPWLHYVPVSQSMEELPELVSFLTLTKSGQRIAKEIAMNGREWLLLEMARLQNTERTPGS
ncbi:hypothetical protein EDB82DRAFT_544712 [Fusarium venenatum]|uniref:uncharacterized protein n=1 Tax=Fusarium venenatum TaxID=56646 RepID=UPI001D8D5906|nr:hypothetical protein EDB82DRAFT_544712 [Fusarium venenatum]